MTRQVFLIAVAALELGCVDQVGCYRPTYEPLYGHTVYIVGHGFAGKFGSAQESIDFIRKNNLPECRVEKEAP